MKKKILKEMEIEVIVCNICEQEITSLPFNKERIQIVRNLFNTENFHAHEGCINSTVKKAFWPFLSEEISKNANKA